MKSILLSPFLLVALLDFSLAQTQVYSRHLKAPSDTTYNIMAPFIQFAIAPSGECLVAIVGITNKGNPFTEIVWLSAAGDTRAAVRLPKDTRLIGFLNFSQSSFCVALESLQKSAVQTFTRKGNRLLRTAALEHGGDMSSNLLPNLPGISGNLGGIGNGKFDYGFIGVREDGSGGLHVSRYKY